MVSFAGAHQLFRPDGTAVNEAQESGRLSVMLTELDWMGRAMRTQRENFGTPPYKRRGTHRSKTKGKGGAEILQLQKQLKKLKMAQKIKKTPQASGGGGGGTGPGTGGTSGTGNSKPGAPLPDK